MGHHKSLFIVFLVILFAFTGVTSTYAETEIDIHQNPMEGVSQEDEGGMFERILATVIEVPIKVVKYITEKSADLKSLDELIFLKGKTLEEKKKAPWSDNEIKFINLWYFALAGISIPFLLVLVTLTAYKIIIAGVNPGARAEAIESIYRWFGAIGIMILAPLLVQTLFWAVSIILEGIEYSFQLISTESGINRDISYWGNLDFKDIDVATGSVLGTAIVKVMFLYLYIWFNTVYLVRKLAISVMLCFTPFMAIMWAFNKNVNAAMIWMGELASNAFMPIAHALVLCIVLGFCDVKNVTDGTWFQILVFMFTLLPLAEVLRNSMQGLLTRMSGLNEERTATGALMTAVGLGGIPSLGRLANATFGKQPLSMEGVSTSNRMGFSPVQVNSPMPNTRGPGGPAGPGGLAPTIRAATQNTMGASEIPRGIDGSLNTGSIGFRYPKEEQGSYGKTQGFANKTPIDVPKGISYAMKASSMLGGAVGGLMGMVGGAVPGGSKIAETLGQTTEGAARFVASTGGLIGQAIHKRATGGSESFGQALRDVTGVKEGGLSGMAKSVARVGHTGIVSAIDGTAGLQQISKLQRPGVAADESLKEPKQIGFRYRAPSKGLT